MGLKVEKVLVKLRKGGRGGGRCKDGYGGSGGESNVQCDRIIT